MPWCPQIRAEVSVGQCNQCNQDLVIRTQYCCQHIDCLQTCDWYGDPKHCALALDPAEALRMNPAAAKQIRELRIQRIERRPDSDFAALLPEWLEANNDIAQAMKSPTFGELGQSELEKTMNRLVQRVATGARVKLVVHKEAGQLRAELRALNKDAEIVLNKILMAHAKNQLR
jgi:hypothetical protein